MTLNELDIYFDKMLKIEDFPSDPSANGIQIQNDFPDATEISKVAFAVDASVETAEKAIEEGANLLFVHHGLFWGNEQRIIKNHYKRVSTFIKNNLALYACHIPLDANEKVGNNYGLARRLGLKELQPFGEWRNAIIGVKGCFSKPLSVDEMITKLFPEKKNEAIVLPFGKKEIRTVGIISGGAGDDVVQAIDDKLDAYITGEIGHENYHTAKEGSITVIGGGHYQTETVGVQLVMEKLQKDRKVQTVFLDVPTGL